MSDRTDIIEIKIPFDITEAIKQVDHIPESIRRQVATKIAEGKMVVEKAKSQSSHAKNLDDKIQLLLEVLVDRSKTGIITTIDEIAEIAGVEIKQTGTMIQKLNRLSRNRGYNIKKITKNNKTAYKIILPTS
jgi:hypothetical protein